MASSDPGVSIADVGRDEDCEAVKRADRPPSDPRIRGIYDKINRRLEAGETFSQLRADNTLPTFKSGKHMLDFPKQRGRGVKGKKYRKSSEDK